MVVNIHRPLEPADVALRYVNLVCSPQAAEAVDKGLNAVIATERTVNTRRWSSGRLLMEGMVRPSHTLSSPAGRRRRPGGGGRTPSPGDRRPAAAGRHGWTVGRTIGGRCRDDRGRVGRRRRPDQAVAPRRGGPERGIPDLEARRADALLAWAQRALNEPGAPTVQVVARTCRSRCRSAPCWASTTYPASWPDMDPSTPTPPAAWPPKVFGADCSRPRQRRPARLRPDHLPPAGRSSGARHRALPRCTSPGCGRAARRCHLDHIHEWRHGGRTCAANLHPVCLRHHTCKSTGTWTVSRGDNGELTWTSPRGRTIQVLPPRLHPIRPPEPGHQGVAPCPDASDPPTGPNIGAAPERADDPPPF